MSGLNAYLQAVWTAYFGVAMWTHDLLNASLAGMALAFSLFTHVERAATREGG